MYQFSRGKYIIIQLGGGPPPEETDDEVEYSIQMPMKPTPRGGLFWLPPTILPSVGPSIVVSKKQGFLGVLRLAILTLEHEIVVVHVY